ncbi:gas vesicle protein K [Actinomycetospora endophytica]|uniref:Gas vesicle protein K n=1 Tax=Actinomycetospora endophytica TaxID=2291215 RepID=A0ABS8PIM9_9PSEU|nr:gas vesicle protein K [Actinomycetospora endophytica]MCD2198115.1 gas vesicle protein K [Actinomycetospora endophytica]
MTESGTNGETPPPAGSGRRVEIDKDAVRRDLMKLVLTIVELLRQLMERQAIRRVDQGDLTEAEEEDLGTSLLLLQEAMDELTEQFGLTAEDLNIDLGPLGPLLPRHR